VLDDHAVNDAPDVDVRPRHIKALRFDSCQQRHRRCAMPTVHGHVMCDELAICDETMVLDRDVVA
jgi:hypothetical protein